MQKLNIALYIAEVYFISAGLGKLPMEASMYVFLNIKAQVEAQTQQADHAVGAGGTD